MLDSKTNKKRRGWMVVSTIISINIQLFSQAITIEPELHMLALGDSYTIGESVRMEERWPHQFIRELTSAGIDAATPDYIATTGWTTQDLLAGIKKDLDRFKSYNLVSIGIGVNNQYQGIHISHYKPDLTELIEQALKIVGGDPGKVFIFSIPDYAYTPFGKEKRSISDEIDAYNTLNKKVAHEYSIPWIDVTSISRMGLSDTSLVAGDGLHPSAAQYRKWVLEIMPRLQLPLK